MTSETERLKSILEHIVKSIESIESYLAKFDLQQFLENRVVQEAVLFNLVIIGEASRDIERRFPEYFEEHRDLPLVDAYRMRNRLVHGYVTIDLVTVWDTSVNDLPELRRKILALHPSIRSSENNS